MKRFLFVPRPLPAFGSHARALRFRRIAGHNEKACDSLLVAG
jgi:hypothetical protein